MCSCYKRNAQNDWDAGIFEHPIQKIYTVLPPSIEEMDELLAFIFTGPCQPTADDFH
jgi:hypothetical protein